MCAQGSTAPASEPWSVSDTAGISSSAARAQWEEPSLDLDIIAEVSRRLKIENVDVVDPHMVGTWIDDNGGIDENTRLDPIGMKFNADYIILFKFNNFG